MRTPRLAGCLALTALLAAGFAAPISAQTPVPVPGPIPVTVDLQAGDDGWTTTNDLRTVLRYDLNPIPAGFFGPGSGAVSTAITLSGQPIANTGGLAWGTDTIVRRLTATGPLAIGGCGFVPIRFIALHLESNPFTVTYDDGTTETWKIVGGLSQASPQPTGNMQICRNCGWGGSFSANLPALFLLRFIRTNPSHLELQLDCGTGACPMTTLRSAASQWAVSGALAGAGFNFDPLPAGIQVDVDADGNPDAATTIGKTSFQGGIKICGTGGGGGGGGGGGAPECATVDHVANDTGPKDHSKSSHGNYASTTGDGDGDGVPDHCECPDEDGDGIDDETGEPCEDLEEDEHPTDF